MKILTSRYAQIGLALIIAVLLLAGVSSSADAASPTYHTVQKGQTLYSIAHWYGTSVWAISCANGIYNPNYIYAGQVLLIPYGGKDGCKPAHKPVVKHEKPYGEHVKYEKPYEPKKEYHDYGKGHKPWGCFHTVRWGEGLFRIGLKYGVSWPVIAHANGLHNANYIYAGQVLRVPCVW
jgi:LysM repeat protein